jgi:hypothetical protein
MPESLCSVTFYDSSKNQARVWHNTSVCGNLINLRLEPGKPFQLWPPAGADPPPGR